MATAAAEVTLPAFFSDSIVLQRDARLPVWGWADEGEKVTVRYAWAANPDCSLANQAGLPASPFRTDDWVVPVVRR